MTEAMEARAETASILRIGFGWTWRRIGLVLGVSGNRAMQITQNYHRKMKLPAPKRRNKR